MVKINCKIISCETQEGWKPTEPADFAVNARIRHPGFGDGTITTVGETNVAIVFGQGEEGETKKLALKFLLSERGNLTILTPKEEVARLRAEQLSPPGLITLRKTDSERRADFFGYLDGLSARAKKLGPSNPPSIEDVRMLQALIEALHAIKVIGLRAQVVANQGGPAFASPRRWEKGNTLQAKRIAGEDNLETLKRWMKLAETPPQEIAQNNHYRGRHWQTTVANFASFADEML